MSNGGNVIRRQVQDYFDTDGRDMGTCMSCLRNGYAGWVLYLAVSSCIGNHFCEAASKGIAG
jgi:hypothetical protein